MMRIVTIGAVITVFALAPSVAAAGNSAAQAKRQISAQVTEAAAKQQRVRLHPGVVFEQGSQQIWRAGNHLMY